MSSLEKRFGPSFHRTFAFNRAAVSALLVLAGRVEREPGRKITKELIRSETLLGIQYVEAMPRYAQAGGLVDLNNRLTALGRHIGAQDISLERQETLWTIHYNFCKEGGTAPRFWGYLFEEEMHPGDELERDRIAQIIRSVTEEQQAIKVSEKTAADAATVFLKTYSSNESLGGLSLLQELGSGRYLVLEHEAPPPLVFALVVADYWSLNLSNTSSVWIDEFNKTGGPAQTLLMGQGQINHAMRELSRMGIATVQLTQPPYQFSPLWKNQDELLDRIYST
jgi:hypothetical protein